MPGPNSFDYAVVRVVPRVERGEFINVGVILICRTKRYLAAQIELDDCGRMRNGSKRSDERTERRSCENHPMFHQH